MAAKRKLWSQDAMKEAVLSVSEGGKGLREASRMYNVPVETLRRRVTGAVEIECKPGPPTVLTKEEELKVYEYLVSMADMGYGLTRDVVMQLAYVIAEKSHRKHPFTGESAGRSWLDGFRRRHPRLTICTPQSLSYCRAISANEEVVSDLFGKVGALYGKLNLFSKPMQVFNADETGITIVHKPSRVFAELGRRNVYSITSAERGKTHTVMACVSASGYVLPPMMVYPRKRAVPENMKVGAVANTLFKSSENGWINSIIYLEWLKFFVQNIPPLRPVLLIQDGHASHISIDVIEFARANSIHMLCLPAHTTHVLQPLDVGVFKSFKTNFSKACTSYLSKHPGRVITPDILASLVAAAIPCSFTSLNILSGFRKCGLFPLNPSAVRDRLGPSKAFRMRSESESTNDSTEGQHNYTEDEGTCNSIEGQPANSTGDELYSIEDLPSNEDPTIEDEPPAIEDPVLTTKKQPAIEEITTMTQIQDSQSSETPPPPSSSTSSDVLSEILVLPAPPVPKRKRKPAINKKAVCITDTCVLEELKDNEKRKEKEKELLAKKKQEREEQKMVKQKQLEEKKKEKEEKKKEREVKKKEKEEEKLKKRRQKEELARQKQQKQKKKGNGKSLEEALESVNLSDHSDVEEEEGSAICPKCGLGYEDDTDNTWVYCDGCKCWFDWDCTKY